MTRRLDCERNKCKLARTPIKKETIDDEALTFNIAVQNSNEASMLVYGCVCNVPEKEAVLNFGATPKIIGVIWTKLDQLFDISTKYDVEKLLKTLYHVKRYPTDREMEHLGRKHAINIQMFTNPIQKMFLSLIHSVVSLVLSISC